MKDLNALVDALADRIADRIHPTTIHQDLPVFWTVKQTMQQTNLGRDTVLQHIHSGKFNAIREAGKFLIDPISVLEWKATRLNNTTPLEEQATTR